MMRWNDHAFGTATALPGVGRTRRANRRAVLGGLAVLCGALFVSGTGYRFETYRALDEPVAEATATSEAELRTLIGELESRNRAAERRLGRLVPAGAYVVVDRTNNRLWLKKGERTVLEALCSTGSGKQLVHEESGQSWRFDTPTGVRRVRGRVEKPTWRKPDWAFVEEGQPIPRREKDRFENGVLGEYALDLGDGYLIHGTLYEGLLGRSLTHGCVRLGRDPLREVYAACGSGTPVYLF